MIYLREHLIGFLAVCMWAALCGVLYSKLESRTKELALADATVTTLQAANDQQAKELSAQLLREASIRQLLNHQNAALAELDQQNRKTADELQEALAMPPMGRPNCAREPLPAGALRLLQPAAAARGDHPGDHASASGGAGTALPGT